MSTSRWSGIAWIVLLAASQARAAETQWWVSDQAADYAKAEVRGAIVRADGVIEAGPEARRFALDSLRTAWAVAPLADGSVAIAGDRGRILRWTAGAGVRPWVSLGPGQVLSLCADGDGLLAGTGPRGLVYRVGARGDTTRLASTGERYVWGIAPAGRGAWWLATGTRGRLMRLEGGKVEIRLDTEESNLVSIAAGAGGSVYVGGDSKGRVYRVRSGGEASTLFDAGEDEIRALCVDERGAVWAAALAASAVSDVGEEDEKPQPVRAPIASGRAIVYRVAPDSGAVTWWASPQPLIYGLVPGIAGEGPLAVTGNRAALYRIERPQGAAMQLATSEGQMTALARGAGGVLWVATANPAALWRVGPGIAADGQLTSGVLDARRFARFGRLAWQGSGSPRFETRSGNSDEPDTTWSRWVQGPNDPEGGTVLAPAARYLQWRAGVPAGARIEQVSVSWREQNLPPRVEDLAVAPQAQNVREGELSTRSDAITQTLPSGQRVEYSMNVNTQKALRELPLWTRGLRTLQWRGLDPNGDPLTYRTLVRRLPDGPWIEIGKDLEASVFTWNTVTLPDGRYRVRVIASDGGGNPIGEETSGEAISEPFGVDNTPPVVSALNATASATSVRVVGSAEDATSPLWRLEAAVDDGNWRTVAPRGGLADRRNLGFEFDLPLLAAGEHLVSVRAVDQAGNAATRAVPVVVPARR